ncbi:MAG: putative rhomboid protease [Caeruleum heppii]|nr:MAG: putative rhomboid protease [Caeruleum heppii]
MAPSFPQFSPTRLRSYVVRLPLATRLIVGFVFAFFWASLFFLSGVKPWGSLAPSKIDLTSLHRLTTYAFIHESLLQLLINLLALTPLLERFEAEHGTLVTFALVSGPLLTLPAGLYVVIEKYVLRGNSAILGASVLVFELLGMEAMKTYKVHPHLSLGPYQIPTWTTPLVGALFVSFLVTNVNLLGHMCGLAVGYLFGLGYLKFLSPPEKILRWFENKLNLLGRLPFYVSVDQKTYGRYGVLPTSNGPENGTALGLIGSSQRLGV